MKSPIEPKEPIKPEKFFEPKQVEINFSNVLYFKQRMGIQEINEFIEKNYYLKDFNITFFDCGDEIFILAKEENSCLNENYAEELKEYNSKLKIYQKELIEYNTNRKEFELWDNNRLKKVRIESLKIQIETAQKELSELEK